MINNSPWNAQLIDIVYINTYFLTAIIYTYNIRSMLEKYKKKIKKMGEAEKLRMGKVLADPFPGFVRNKNKIIV